MVILYSEKWVDLFFRNGAISWLEQNSVGTSTLIIPASFFAHRTCVCVHHTYCVSFGNIFQHFHSSDSWREVKGSAPGLINIFCSIREAFPIFSFSCSWSNWAALNWRKRLLKKLTTSFWSASLFIFTKQRRPRRGLNKSVQYYKGQI